MKRSIKLLVIDVDGTMTDGGIYYDGHENEMKKFCTRDAAGFFTARQMGIKIMVLTGRECAATTRRMTEMKVEYLCQDVRDKARFLQAFMAENRLTREDIGYIGDDLNDLPPMRLSGFIGCPADSCQEVKEVADYISPMRGGDGVVRDVVEHLLRESGEWDAAISALYGIGI